MNKFIFVKPRTTWARDNVVGRIAKHGMRWVPIAGKNVHLYFFPKTGAAVFSVESGDGLFGREIELYRNEDQVLAIDGMPYLEGATLPDLMESGPDLLRTLYKDGIETLYRSLRGSYSLTALIDGRLLAFSDFSGFSPLFYLDTSDFAAVSNRQSLLHMVCSRSEAPCYDLAALSWLLAQCNLVGETGVFAGVRKLLPGSWVEINGEGQLSVKRFQWQLWHPHGGHYGDTTSADFDQATECLLNNFQAMEQLVHPSHDDIRMSITGGKDSRLNLALALQSGLAPRLRMFTSGPVDSPEIECAHTVLSHFGLDHHAQYSQPGEFSADDVFQKVRHGIFRYEGSICPWDGLSGVGARKPWVDIAGLGGEMYRRFVKSRRRVTIETIDQAKAIWENWKQPTDQLKVLRPEVVEQQHKSLHQWIEMRHQDGVPLNDLDEVFYVENRIGWWAGMIASNKFATHRLFPLVHPCVANMVFKGGAIMRQTDRFHFEIMRRLAPWLVEAPFLNDKWDTRLAPHHGELKVSSSPFDSRKPAILRNIKSWQFQFIEQALAEIRDVILSNVRSGILEICDETSLWRALSVATGRLDPADTRSILSLLAIQILLTDGYTMEKDTCLGVDESGWLHSNVTGVALLGKGRFQELSLA